MMALTSATSGVSPVHCEDVLLQKAYKKIADLKEDVKRLSVELEMKDLQLSGFTTRLPILSSFLMNRAEQPSKLTSDNDTVVWDPSSSACLRPPCSTPNMEAPWSEVVTRNRKKDVSRVPISPSLATSNRFDVLSPEEFPVLQAAAPVPPIPPRLDQDAAPADNADSAAIPPPVADGDRAADHPKVKPLPSTSTSSVRRKLLKEAVRRHSGCFPHRDSVAFPPASTNLPPGPPTSSSSSLRPLFPPTTAIVGDSIIRNVRFFNAVTHCFPGTTVPSLLQKLPELLGSLPSSVKKVIIHLGFNDTSFRQSEETKKHFLKLFNLLRGCGKTVLISGPLPSFGRGAGRFSRLLSLNTWLQSACTSSGFTFIDNFNLFWNRSLFYMADGVHPSKLGSRVLADNIRHAVQVQTTSTPD